MNVSRGPRVFHCAMCDALIPATSTTNDDPECPEMVQFRTATFMPWVGIVGDADTRVHLVVVCSEACLGQLLRVPKT